jgi:hypothetical protein
MSKKTKEKLKAEIEQLIQANTILQARLKYGR